MEKNLIYDVGLNNGDDTAYYLHRGFKVVAVEADPTLVEKAQTRFAKEISDGQLELVNLAIGPKDEIAQFWICEDRSEWNSFSRAMATRDGAKAYAIDVQCGRFGDLLKKHGVPYYLKIDIEGHDHYCLEDLDPNDLPVYLSLELAPIDDLFTLHKLGFTAFKIICQVDFSQCAIDPFCLRQLVMRRLRAYPRLAQTVQRLTKIGKKPSKSPQSGSTIAQSPSRQDGDAWQFRYGSTGPFGEDTQGPWRDLEYVSYAWLTYNLHYRGRPRGVWHDVHASRKLPTNA